MEPANPILVALSPEEVRRLDAWLREFDLKWDADAFTCHARQLPPDGAFRRAALAGMVNADLRRQWHQGRKKFLEEYLRDHPELGTAETVTLELIQAELQARQQAGETVSREELARRFPRQTEQLGRDLDRLWQRPANATDAGAARGTLPPSISSMGGTLRPDTAPDVILPGPSAPAALPGGRYEFLKVLGRGAMGTVYLAQDTQLQRQVALKIPHFQPGDSAELIERFYREARAAAKLDHPNICPVYDVGTNEDGTPYLTMAYIEGQPLAELVRVRQSLPQRRAVEIVHKLACALDEAHRHGVIHRDLKPANVMMNRRGEPVVMDFGLARRDQDVRLTHEGSLLGTPAYMSPEQVEGDRDAIGPASDQYSLGVMLYEMLTGQLPYLGSMGQIMAAILTEAPRPPSSLRPDLDPALEKICLRAMARNPADRYPSTGAFAAALAGRMQIASQPSPDVLSAPDRPRTDFQDDTLPVQPGQSWKPRRRRPLTALIAGGVLAVLGALGYLLWAMTGSVHPVPVAIHSTPAGAVVFLDDKRQEPAEDGQYLVAPGTHELRLELAGHHPLRQELRVRAEDAGKPFRFELKKVAPDVLTPAEVEVAIRSKPAGADIHLDGKRQARRTNATFRLRPGGHELRLELAAHEPRVVRIQVTPDGNGQAFDYTMSRMSRDVILSLTPPDARLVIDGEPQPPGAEHKARLTMGKHQVRLDREGYKPRTEEIAVSEGVGPQRFQYELEPLRGANYALLVGVHQPGGGLPDFLHAEPDVVELGRLLVAGGYARANVLVLTQTLGARRKELRPDAATIRERLRALLRRCTPADNVLVAFVGHAVRPPGADASQFCPAGTDLKDRKTLLPLAEVYDELRECKARARLLLLDCWRRGEGGGGPRPKVIAPGGEFPVLLACAPGEVGYEHPDRRHGAFVSAVLRELLRPGDSLTGLAQAVRKNVAALERREKGAAQTPELLGGPKNAARPPLRLGTVLAAFARGATSLEKAERLKDEAKQTAAYTAAVAALDEAAGADPQFVEAYTARAEAHYRLDKFDQAAADCRQALDLDPDTGAAHSHLAEALTKLGKYEQALASHDAAIRLEPAYAEAYNDRGQTQFASEKYDEAIKDFSEALRLNPRLKWAWLNRGSGHYKRNAFDQSIADETRAIALDGDFANAWFVRGLARLRKKQPKEDEAAVKDFSETIRLEPANPLAYSYRAQAHSALGDAAAAKADRETARKLRAKQQGGK